MPDFFIILLKINLVLVLFAAAYYLILRRLTFYVINRIFLVFGILFSTIYPFIDLTDFFHRQNQQLVAFVPEINHQVKSLVPSGFIAEYWTWIGILFYVGVAFMGFRLFIQFVSLYKMHKKSSPGSVADFKVRILHEPVSPFSFWQTVYINPTLHKDRELRTILEHEQIHVKEWHSLDIILAELSVVFYWFNPGVWLMKKAVKENLEFITDEKILKKGVDKKAYQYSLLDVGNLNPAVQIVNNFNLSDLKKRIKMMNASRSSKFTLSRYILILPALLLTTLAFTISKKDIKKHFAPIKQALITAKLLDTVKEEIIVDQKKGKGRRIISKSTMIPKAEVDTISNFHFIVKTLDVKTDTLNLDLSQKNIEKAFFLSLKGDTDAQHLQGKGRVILIKRDSLAGKDHANVIENITIELAQAKKVNLPTKPYLDNIIVKRYKSEGKPADSIINRIDHTTFFLNGKQISEEELKKIDPKDVKHVKVQKDKLLSEMHIISRANEG